MLLLPLALSCSVSWASSTFLKLSPSLLPVSRLPLLEQDWILGNEQIAHRTCPPSYSHRLEVLFSLRSLISQLPLPSFSQLNSYRRLYFGHRPGNFVASPYSSTYRRPLAQFQAARLLMRLAEEKAYVPIIPSLCSTPVRPGNINLSQPTLDE